MASVSLASPGSFAPFLRQLHPSTSLTVVQGCTLSCEPGPFWTTDAPLVPSGSLLAKPSTEGEPLFFSATVKNTKGEPIEGVIAEVVRLALRTLLHFRFTLALSLLIAVWCDVAWCGVIHGRCSCVQWQADGEGAYDVQDPNRDGADDRGRIIAQKDGYFCYKAVLPTAYPIVRLHSSSSHPTTSSP